jgi:hypothetical protein
MVLIIILDRVGLVPIGMDILGPLVGEEQNTLLVLMLVIVPIQLDLVTLQHNTLNIVLMVIGITGGIVRMKEFARGTIGL